MKKSTLLFFLVWLVLLPACAADEEPTKELEPTVLPAPTKTVIAAPTRSLGNPTPTSADAYPIEPAPTNSDAYPALPQPPPTSNAYPVDQEVWILHAAGEQCEDGLFYPDLASATSDLEGAGVTVLSAEAVSLMVCTACGCPTSEHYRSSDQRRRLCQSPELELGRGIGKCFAF